MADLLPLKRYPYLLVDVDEVINDYHSYSLLNQTKEYKIVVLNPFLNSGLVHLYNLDESISSLWGFF